MLLKYEVIFYLSVSTNIRSLFPQYTKYKLIFNYYYILLFLLIQLYFLQLCTSLFLKFSPGGLEGRKSSHTHVFGKVTASPQRASKIGVSYVHTYSNTRICVASIIPPSYMKANTCSRYGSGTFLLVAVVPPS